KLTQIISLAKPVLNRLLGPVTQTEHSFYVLACSISSGTSPIAFAWQFNSRPIAKSADFVIETSDQLSLLKLPHVKRSHAGEYSCIARNDDGSDSITVKLIVQGCTLYFVLSEYFYCWPTCGAN